ncbi:MAG: HD domain-containing protein [Gracilimonas sp.]|uniref:HD domain-containing protein n=1 Tax=Gracilimonas TaxID=649462 RepID=UPI001B0FE4A7|nr:HD domain-containing protein [Gracilimonas sp.]MBO6586480.1 HD domain-containing protein [Gracilimonas sp.]MBO6615137.1 HD domain-containing protein [Gracilimonas sp.]
MAVIKREASVKLLKEFIKGESLLNHSMMVARAMEGYGRALNKSEQQVEEWWTAGLLHDLDWEKYPDEHPHKAVNEILPEHDYPESVIEAIKAHAPERTGKEPNSEIERYLFACDELSGFMNAVSLMRPNGFEDMKVKSVTKKLKDAKFAANVPREDIRKGAELIGKELNDHITFLIGVFRS